MIEHDRNKYTVLQYVIIHVKMYTYNLSIYHEVIHCRYHFARKEISNLKFVLEWTLIYLNKISNLKISNPKSQISNLEGKMCMVRSPCAIPGLDSMESHLKSGWLSKYIPYISIDPFIYLQYASRKTFGIQKNNESPWSFQIDLTIALFLWLKSHFFGYFCYLRNPNRRYLPDVRPIFLGLRESPRKIWPKIWDWTDIALF